MSVTMRRGANNAGAAGAGTARNHLLLATRCATSALITAHNVHRTGQWCLRLVAALHVERHIFAESIITLSSP